MKTIEKKFGNQMSLLLLILFPLMTGMSSCQKDKTDELNITDFRWELMSITMEGTKHKKPKEDFHNPDAYILSFENDSTFWLNFSINSGYGKYQINTNGNIEIKSYTNITEASMTDFDEKLLSVFKLMISYTLIGKTLTFEGNNNEVELKRI